MDAAHPLKIISSDDHQYDKDHKQFQKGRICFSSLYFFRHDHSFRNPLILFYDKNRVFNTRSFLPVCYNIIMKKICWEILL